MNYYFICKVLSNSMYPKIRINDTVLIKKINYNLLVKKDIICFTHNGMLFVHRIVRQDILTSYTKGDNNKIIDSVLLTSDNYVGKALYIIRNNRVMDLYSNIEEIITKEDNNYYCYINNTILIFNETLSICREDLVSNI